MPYRPAVAISLIRPATDRSEIAQAAYAAAATFLVPGLSASAENNFLDAEAIAEAVAWQNMRFAATGLA